MFSKNIYITFHGRKNENPEYETNLVNQIKGWINADNEKIKFLSSETKSVEFSLDEKRQELKKQINSIIDNCRQVLLITDGSAPDTPEWLNHEIEQTVDINGLPITVIYTNEKIILEAQNLIQTLPIGLKHRIDMQKVACMHVPMQRRLIQEASTLFNRYRKPRGGSMGVYSKDVYLKFGLLENE